MAKAVSLLPSALDALTSKASDPDVAAYVALSGATDVANLDAFVKGVKDLGLWENMVCWPLRGNQNSGSGTTVYSLGGLGPFNGTLAGDPVWGTDALDFTADGSCMTTEVTLPGSPVALVVVRQAQAGENNAQAVFFTAGDGIGGRQFALFNQAISTRLNFNAYIDSWGTAPTFGQLFNRAGATGLSREYQAWRMLGPSSARLTRNTSRSLSNIGSYIGGWDTSSFVRYGYYPSNASNDTLSFMAHFTAVIDNTTDAAFYDLYKATLGIGLGLP